MEAMRQSWTDDRLDDLSRNMGQRFDRVEAAMDQGFGKVEREMDQRFAKVQLEMEQRFGKVEREMDQRFGKVDREMDRRFGKVEGEIRDLRAEAIERDRHREAEFSALQRTMIQVGGGLIAANLGFMAAMLGLIVTQL
jgi:hypothetical protein